jgi:hypothetical protein
MGSYRIEPALVMVGMVAAHPARADVAKGSNPAGTVQPGPPSFRSIAGSGMSADQLRTFLTHPYGAMPDLSLTRAEIDDLVIYIETLR